MDESIKEYGLSPEHLKATRRRGLIAIAVLWIVVPAFFLLAFPRLLAPPGRTPSPREMIPTLLVLLSAQTAFMLWASRAWGQSFRLFLHEEAIGSRTVVPGIAIRRDEVTQIVELSNDHSLIVKTADPARFLVVPKAVSGFDEIRAELSAWRAIEPQRVMSWPVYVVPIVAVGGAAAFALAHNVVLVIALSVLVLGGLVGGCVLMARSQVWVADHSLSRGLKGGCLIVAISIAFGVGAFVLAKLGSVLGGTPWPR